ncbi:Unknown protein [Striga hermonthica]|uniref:Uncharacterized protein n=1 Tax=Striga hermonthica TaxID=68872 RepID=A0A9N7NQE0_STRHE|nr:Unknown protein [Striga hermonthica]
MSTALQRTTSAGCDHQIDLKGFGHRSMASSPSAYNPQEFSAVDRKFPESPELEAEDHGDSLSSSITSSIGKNSDDSTAGAGGDGEEVQSEYKGGPLESLDALEEVLPMKKSISQFYSGKSKSFTSLSDAAACPSIDEITKPENVYTRKRKNLIAFNNIMDKNRDSIMRSTKGGISKRPNSCRSMVALVAAANVYEANSAETSCSFSSLQGSNRPPLPPHVRRALQPEPLVLPTADKLSSCRSFSLSDLQVADADEDSKASVAGSWINNGDHNNIK